MTISHCHNASNETMRDEERCVLFMVCAFTDGLAKTEAAARLREAVYISMVLRIRPTARPSISKGSPGSIRMVW